ncbi:hypothetical protein FORC066_2996 [Yersinia enterocolitica]|nr:hypothetical protein FORC066_2996 [Yersinia enterocolitica]
MALSHNNVVLDCFQHIWLLTIWLLTIRLCGLSPFSLY